MTDFAGDVLSPVRRLARGAWQGLLVLGIISILLGVAVLAWPRATLVVVGFFFGVYLLVSGIVQLVYGFGSQLTTGLRVLTLISGALSIILAMFCFRGTTQSILLLAIWIGVGWLFRGIAQTMSAIGDPGTTGRGWQIFTGIVAILAGGVLMVAPISSIGVLTVVAGVWLIAMGIVEIGTALKIRTG